MSDPTMIWTANDTQIASVDADKSNSGRREETGVNLTPLGLDPVEDAEWLAEVDLLNDQDEPPVSMVLMSRGGFLVPARGSDDEYARAGTVLAALVGKMGEKAGLKKCDEGFQLWPASEGGRSHECDVYISDDGSLVRRVATGPANRFLGWWTLLGAIPAVILSFYVDWNIGVPTALWALVIPAHELVFRRVANRFFRSTAGHVVSGVLIFACVCACFYGARTQVVAFQHAATVLFQKHAFAQERTLFHNFVRRFLLMLFAVCVEGASLFSGTYIANKLGLKTAEKMREPAPLTRRIVDRLRELVGRSGIKLPGARVPGAIPKLDAIGAYEN